MKKELSLNGMLDPDNLIANNTAHRPTSKPKRKRPSAVYEHIPIGIVESSLDGKDISCSEQFCQLLGYHRWEILQLGIQDVTHEEDYFVETKLLDQLLAGTIPFYKLTKRYIRRDGRQIWVELTRSVVRNSRKEPLYTMGAVLDITERRHTEKALAEFARQQESLYKLADRLNRINSLQDLFDAALNAILDALQCDRASILLFDEKNVMRFVAWRGLSDEYRKATDGHSPWKSDEKQPVPICMDNIDTADLSDPLRSVIREEGIGSLSFIPLVSKVRLIGKFMVYFNADHAFSGEEVDLSLTIASQLAVGIERKRNEDALVQARQQTERTAERIARLQQITAAIASVATSEQVAQVLLQEGKRAVGAAAGSLVEVSDNGAEIRTIASLGYPSAAVRTGPLSLSVSSPMSDCILSRQAIWIGSHRDLAIQYPRLAGRRADLDHEAAMALPLMFGDRVIGGLAFSFVEQQAFDQEERNSISQLRGSVRRVWKERVRMMSYGHVKRSTGQSLKTSRAAVCAW